MSSTWNEGYLTDMGYTYGYYREINPVHLRFCLLLSGYAPVESADPVHCELGFGQGVSINIHAAANPGHYVGTDFNPSHAAQANSLAASYDSRSRFYDDSFEQLLARNDLPPFDSISLHGIWSWVGHEHRQQITEFVRRHLKPGGMLYNSYNCLPGWSVAAPLRQLFSLHDRFMPHASNVPARVDSALKFSETLLAANPLYANTVSGLSERLQTIMGQNRHYVAHEYFNREWNCMYFSEVVDALTPAKVEFAATADLLDTVDAINLSREGSEFLKGIEHPVLREQARDYFVNRQFRRDLYTRGAVRLSEREQARRLLDTRFVLTRHPDDIPVKVVGALGEASLQPGIYAPIIEVLAARAHAPKTLQHLQDALPGQPRAALIESLTVLSGLSVVEPCQSEAAELQVQARCAALNAGLIQQAHLDSKIDFLASPVTGGGVAISRFQKLFLAAISQQLTQPQEWALYVWRQLQLKRERLIKNGQPLVKQEENIAELRQQAEQFNLKLLPVLKALRIA